MSGQMGGDMLADLVVELANRVRNLEAGRSTSQLPFSSISDPRRGLVLQDSTTNLVENPSFELGDDLWSTHDHGSTGTVTVGASDLQSLHGGQSLRITSSSMGVADLDELGAYTIVEVDSEYTVASHISVYAETFDENSHEMFLGMVWFDTDLNEIGRVQTPFTPTVGEWVTSPIVTTRVPPEITIIAMICYVNGKGPGGPQPVEVFLDGAMFYYGSVFTSYVDGDQENAQWDGPPHMSTSSRTPDPLGNRVVAAAGGFRQYDADGQQIVSVGATPDTGETYTTIIDPATGGALSTMSNVGDYSGTAASFTDDIEMAGQSLVGYVESAPRSLEAYARKTTNSDWTGANVERGIMELQFTARPGHHYRVETPPLLLESASSTGIGRFHFRATFDESAPSVSSTVVAAADVGNGQSTPVSWTHHETSGSIVRVLLTLQDRTGTGTGARMVADTVRPMVIDVVDMGGQEITNTGIVNDSSGGGGGTGGGGAGTRRTKQYLPTWSASYRQNGSRRTDKGNLLYQGYVDSFNGIQNSMVGFNSTAIQSDLDGATVEKIRLRVYSQHWYNNSGGTLVVGDHNRSSRPSSHPGYTGPISDPDVIGRWSMKKPELKWLNILSGNNWLINALKNGDTKGFVFDVNHLGTSAKYYGYMHGVDMKYEPILEITYVK